MYCWCLMYMYASLFILRPPSRHVRCSVRRQWLRALGQDGNPNLVLRREEEVGRAWPKEHFADFDPVSAIFVSTMRLGKRARCITCNLDCPKVSPIRSFLSTKADDPEFWVEVSPGYRVGHICINVSNWKTTGSDGFTCT